jgi:hypothetical protein
MAYVLSEESERVLVWLDDDAFVQQLGVHPLEWLQHYDVAIGQQADGVLNTGVIVLRNTAWTRGLVRAWLSDPACDGFKHSPTCCWDQVMLALLRVR